MQTAKALETAPFIGPRPFKEEESGIFFGRERETAELVSLISAHPIVLLYAPSGAGKTSLVNAGLIPTLKGTVEKGERDPNGPLEEFDVFKPMRVQGEIPRGSSFDVGNIYVVNALLSGADTNIDPSKLLDMTLATFLEGRAKKVNEYREPVQRVVIFDQFEELFTSYPEHWEKRKEFFEQVSDALVGNQKKHIEGDPMLRVVFSMREDYVAELDPYANLMPGCLRTRFRLEQMTEKAAMTAVEVPFEKKGITLGTNVARDLVKSLLKIPCKNDLGGPKYGQYVEPVQLQIVCQSLWESLRPGETIITQGHLQTYGDLNQVLSDFYEKGIKKVAEKTGQPESNLRVWFENTLIVDGNRAPVTQGREKAGGMPNDVVELLEKKSLLKKEWRGSGTVLFELAHDHFIEPIRRSNEAWRAKQDMDAHTLHHLEAKALRWQQGDEGFLEEDELLAGSLLIQGPVKPSERLREFVKASEAATQQKRARARYRRYKFAAAALAVVLLFVSGLAGYAYRKGTRAEEASVEAEKARIDAEKAREEEKKARTDAEKAREEEKNARIEAEKARVEAETAKGDAIEQRDKAEEQTKIAKKSADYAEEQRLEAKRQQKIAEDEKQKAQTALVDAQQARSEAIDQKTKIEKAANRANSRLSAITARSYLEDDPELSVLLVQRASEKFGGTRASEEVMRAGLAALSTGNQVLRNHERRINYVELSPDGSRVIAASDDNKATLWTPKTDDKKTLEKHTRPVVRAAFSPDGKLLVTASLDTTAGVWDAETGASIAHLATHSGSLTRAVWSPDSKYIATGSEDTTIKIWNARTGEEIEKLTGHEKSVQDLAWSNDGLHIASEGLDGTGRIWHLKKDKPVLNGDSVVLQGLKGFAPAIAFSPDSKMLVTEIGPGQARVWNVENGEPMFVLGDVQSSTLEESYRSTITSVAFSPDNKLIVSTSSDGSARVWMVAQNGRLVSELRGHTRSIYTAQFSPDSRLVVTASADNTARVWDAETGESLLVLNGHSGGVKSADFDSRKRNIIVTGSDDGTARVWDTTSGQRLLPNLPNQAQPVSSAAFSPDADNAYVATTGYDGTLRLWDTRTRAIRTTGQRHAHYARISYAAFNSDGRYLVTTSFDKTAKVWAVDKNHLIQKSVLGPHRDRVFKAAFSPDSQFVVTVSLDKTARVWNAATGTLVGQLGNDQNFSEIPYGVDWSPDGNSIITGGSDKVIRIWDARTFKLKREQRTPHSLTIYGVRYDSTGNRIVTASEDGTATVWNTISGEVNQLTGHIDDVNSAAFSPNGEFLVTSSNDKTARVWDTRNWKLINVLRGQKGKVFTAGFSRDNQYIVTASDDGTVNIYGPEMFAVPSADLPELVRQRVHKSLPAIEWEKFMSDNLLDQ